MCLSIFVATESNMPRKREPTTTKASWTVDSLENAVKEPRRGGAMCLVLAILADAAGENIDGKKTDSTPGKADAKQEVPTFVCSDGVVREVSPAAILNEMKRCLPPGIPLPMDSLWPELPPDLGKIPNKQNEDQNLNQSDYAVDRNNTRTIFDLGLDGSCTGCCCTSPEDKECKRVLRSEEASKNEAGETGSSARKGDRFGEDVRESNVFSPISMNSNNIADLLKKLLASQLSKNASDGNHNGKNSEGCKHKYDSKLNDYSDYDYEEEEPPTRGKSKQRASYSSSERHRKRVTNSRGRYGKKGRRYRAQAPSNVGRSAPDYDYEYVDSEEDSPVSKASQKELKAMLKYQDPAFSSELVKQVELNDELRTLTKNLLGNTDTNLDKFDLSKYIKHRLPLLGSAISPDSSDGIRKVLGVVMELNTILVRLLDRAVPLTANGKASSKSGSDGASLLEGGHEQGETDKSLAASSILFDIMELLMQKRKGGRSISSSTNKRLMSHNTEDDVAGLALLGTSSPKGHSNHSIHRTDLNFLKWLLKWYLTTTSA